MSSSIHRLFNLGNLCTYNVGQKSTGKEIEGYSLIIIEACNHLSINIYDSSIVEYSHMELMLKS